jgi:hypothetical protein
MPTFWLSFTDPGRPSGDRHLHIIIIIIIAADDLDAADEIARSMGAVGEVSVADLDGCDPMPPAAFMNRVLMNSDIDDMESALAAKASAVAAVQRAVSLPQGSDASVRWPCIDMFTAIQDLMSADEFAALDATLVTADVSAMRTVVMVALPRYCFVARESLPFWQAYVDRGYAELVRRGEDADSIMRGLTDLARPAAPATGPLRLCIRLPDGSLSEIAL